LFLDQRETAMARTNRLASLREDAPKPTSFAAAGRAGRITCGRAIGVAAARPRANGTAPPHQREQPDARRAVRGAGWVMAILLTAATVGPTIADAADPANLKSDETVIVLPTAAWLEPGGDAWIVPLHAWVFEREPDSFWRTNAVGNFADWLGLPEGSESIQHFRERALDFLVDNESGKRIELSIGGRRSVRLPTTGGNGHAESAARVSIADLPPRDGNPWVSAAVVPDQGDRRGFAGAVQLVAPRGLSVISDIDDTIKISHVTDKKQLLAHTFLNAFEPVPGMAAVYRSWQEAGAVFHYVSSSPWQLYPALAAFMSDADFPNGSFHLRYFRVKDESFLNLFASSKQTKPPVIEALLEAYPGRDFVLVGDSGESDPEIYGAIARAHPERIRHIAIRLVTPERRDNPRMQAAFASLPEDRWSLFEDPGELTLPIGTE
jgi:hypothetical protein